MKENLEALKIAREEAGEIRTFSTKEKIVVGTIAIAWALFQLAISSFLILDSIKIRSIHLAFAIALVFLHIPFKRTPVNWFFRAFYERSKIPVIDYIFALCASFFALYIMLDWEGLVLRSGSPITRDIVIGVLLVVFLLEATRRSIGPALPVIVLFFTAYAFLGPWMPDFLAFQGVSLTKYLNQISLSPEGIYGIPLGVSASIVFLFVLLGTMLDRAGAGQFFTDLALSILGKYKGGPAKAAVVSSGLSGLISGSSIANIVTTGTFTIPLMKKVGYPAKKAAATEVAASTDGQLMPPIMGAAAFIIAEYVNVPYMEVVKAAIVPALVSYFALFYITHLEASKLGIRGLPKEDIPSFLGTLRGGLHFLIPIGVLIFELIILRHSPEMSAFRAIVTLVVIVFYLEIKKGIKNRAGFRVGFIKSCVSALQVIGEGMIKGSKNMMSVAMATAAAGIIVGIVGMGLGGMITQIVEVLAQGNIFLLLFITAVASLLLGMGLPTTATYIVMASLTAPIIVTVGASYNFFIPLMAAHLFVFYFGILADDTPPVGLASYAAAAIANSKPIPTGIQAFMYDLRTAVIPFMFVFNPELILYGVSSWWYGLFVFSMALFGAFAFTSAVQHWFLVSNRWFETPLLLLSSVILFNPKAFDFILLAYMSSNLSPHIADMNKFIMYGIGMVLFGIVYFGQRYRMRLNEIE